jgi:hypothetical protein
LYIVNDYHMPFQKGNQLGKHNAHHDGNKRGQWNNIVGWLVGDGGGKYKEALGQLSQGKDIPKPQKEFLEHYETLLEFHQPKLARQQTDVDLKGNIEFVIKKPDETN